MNTIEQVKSVFHKTKDHLSQMEKELEKIGLCGNRDDKEARQIEHQIQTLNQMLDKAFKDKIFSVATAQDEK